MVNGIVRSQHCELLTLALLFGNHCRLEDSTGVREKYTLEFAIFVPLQLASI